MSAEHFTASRIEHCLVQFHIVHAVKLDDARRLRGAIALVMGRQEFHNHIGDKLIYTEPLIRYDASEGKLRIVGICNGAILLKELPHFESIRLGQNDCSVHQQTVTPSRVEVGTVEDPIRYRFISEYLPLNQENDERWRRTNKAGKEDLLRRILIGNVLSFAKGINMSVTSRLEVDCHLEPVGFRILKPGVRMLAFTGHFSLNFKLPTMWGLGKSTSRGFGTIVQLEASE